MVFLSSGVQYNLNEFKQNIFISQSNCAETPVVRQLCSVFLSSICTCNIFFMPLCEGVHACVWG